MSDDIVEVMARAAYDGSSKRLARRDGSVRTRWSELYDPQKAPYLQDARDELAALEAAGYAVVPVVPTEAMQEAALRTIMFENKGVEYGPSLGWKAMLSASKAR